VSLSEIKERWEKGYDLYSDDEMKQFHSDVKWLIKQAEKADKYEDLALDHQYQTILELMD
jgi:hypothetical protein